MLQEAGASYQNSPSFRGKPQGFLERGLTSKLRARYAAYRYALFLIRKTLNYLGKSVGYFPFPAELSFARPSVLYLESNGPLFCPDRFGGTKIASMRDEHSARGGKY